MPGSSLWLIPPKDHPLQPLLTKLIKDTSKHFSSPHLFIPHVTLTADISPASYGDDPQAWLDGLPFPEGKKDDDAAVIKLGQLRSEPVFVRKLYSSVDKDGVREIARISRRCVSGFGDDRIAGEWAESQYWPHLSLLYHDCEVVGEEGLKKVESMAEEAGVRLDGVGEMGGWRGGRVVLVPTEKKIGEWEVIASREL